MGSDDRAAIEAMAHAICRERCAFMGEPACHDLPGEWPPSGCDEPNCVDMARAALSALPQEPHNG